MIDIVIPYRTDTAYGGVEVSYCIKSLRKHLKGFGRIITVGGKHKHADGHIPFTETSTRKQWNIVSKIKAACDCPDISDPFICMSDDIYLLKDLQVSDIKYWHNGLLTSQVRSGQYAHYVRNSISIGATHNHDIHAPIIYHKQEFIKRVFSRFDLFVNMKDDYLIQSLYCIKEPGEFMEDVKINRRMPVHEIMVRIEDQLRFSTGPCAVTIEMKKVWAALYD